MIKVKEYLDLNFEQEIPSEATLKKNNHYEVHGSWVYPRGYKHIEYTDGYQIDFSKIPDHIQLTCNNETIIVALIFIQGKYVSKYHYLQTYEHIPRGEPDINGYYSRSTDDEIINYIDGYLKQIKEREND